MTFPRLLYQFKVSNFGLGVNKNTLYAWIGQYHRPVKNQSDNVAEEHIYDEEKRLRLETSRLKEERNILKKAAAYRGGLSKSCVMICLSISF